MGWTLPLRCEDYKTPGCERILQVLPESLLASRQQPARLVFPNLQVVPPCDVPRFFSRASVPEFSR